jgi:hypothetical protein
MRTSPLLEVGQRKPCGNDGASECARFQHGKGENAAIATPTTERSRFLGLGALCGSSISEKTSGFDYAAIW